MLLRSSDDLSWTLLLKLLEGLFFCPDFMALNGVRIPDCVIGDQHMQFPMQRPELCSDWQLLLGSEKNAPP